MAYKEMGSFDSNRPVTFETAEHRRKPWTFYDKVTFQGATRQIVIEDGTIKGFTVAGDIFSDDWNGGYDLSGGADGTATLGYLLDYDSGRAQFQTIYAEGGTLGDLTITGDVTIGTGGSIQGGTINITYLQPWDDGVRIGGSGVSGQELLIGDMPDGVSVRPISGAVPQIYGYTVMDVDSNIQWRVLGSGETLAADGDSSGPGYAFHADTNTGMYRLAENQIGWSVGGRRLGLSQSSLNFGDGSTTGYPRIKVNAIGSASLPAYHFVGDENTGFYWNAADIFSAAAGGNEVIRIQESTTSTVTSGSRGTTFIQATELGGTSGNEVTVASFGGDSGVNNTYIDVGQIRHTNGTSWVDMAMFLRRRTDATEQAGIYFDNNNIGINISDPTAFRTLTVNGTFAHKPASTTGSAVVLQSLGSSYYALNLSSSARRFKTDITDAELADVVLQPRRFVWKETGAVEYGFIAEEVIEAIGDEAGDWLDDGEVLNYKDRAVLAVLTAKVNRLEALTSNCACGKIRETPEEL